MYKIIHGNSTKYFKENNIKNKISLILTSPSYFIEQSKKDLIKGEIGYGENKEKYVESIFNVLSLLVDKLKLNGKIILLLGRYNDLSIKSIIYMLEEKLLKINVKLNNYSLYGKGDHESIVIFSKGMKEEIKIPIFSELQIYDREGFFGRINPQILEWAIINFTNKGD